MQCIDFREVSEAYLSDELLVETNLRVHRHMENCSECRSDFAARRRLRTRLRKAVTGSSEFAISPAFETRLNARLREEAMSKPRWLNFFSMPRVLASVMAALIFTVFGGFIALQYVGTPFETASSATTLSGYLTDVALKAVGNHKDCALDKMENWDSYDVTTTAQDVQLAEVVVESLRSSYEGEVDILHSHDCTFEGRKFSHVIARRKGGVISIFFDNSGKFADLREDYGMKDSIISEKENGMQVASFKVNGMAVFVVSEMPEPENLQVARSIADSFSV